MACAAGGRRQVYVHAEVRARPGDRLVRNVARDPRAGLRAHRVRLVIHTRNRDIRSSVRVPRLVYCTRCSNCTSQWRHYSKLESHEASSNLHCVLVRVCALMQRLFGHISGGALRGRRRGHLARAAQRLGPRRLVHRVLEHAAARRRARARREPLQLCLCRVGACALPPSPCLPARSRAARRYSVNTTINTNTTTYTNSLV